MPVLLRCAIFSPNLPATHIKELKSVLWCQEHWLKSSVTTVGIYGKEALLNSSRSIPATICVVAVL